jgi:hypothetical protein
MGVAYDSLVSPRASSARVCFQMSLPVAGSSASRYDSGGAFFALGREVW